MHSLLIVIDMQNGWRHPVATEQTMQDVVKLCAQFSGDVIHCCFRNDPASLFHTQLHWYEFTTPKDTDQIPEIVALNLPVQWRTTYSCLTPEMRKIVAEYEQVYIAGVFTDISVASTAMDIFDMNIPVSVVGDCVATLHGEDVHQAALKSLASALGPRNIVSSANLATK